MGHYAMFMVKQKQQSDLWINDKFSQSEVADEIREGP